MEPFAPARIIAISTATPVIVEDPTLSFSPYFLSSFSFDDFVTHAFPDIAMDLDSIT